MNYQQLGDAKSANKAIRIELHATEVHLHKAWRSKESYYRQKYAGWKRAKAFIDWLDFKALDFIWGNGESTIKLIRAVLLILALIALIDVIASRDPNLLDSYTRAFAEAPQVFLGTLSPGQYPTLYLTLILLVRLVTFGFLMAIIIKRFNRR